MYPINLPFTLLLLAVPLLFALATALVRPAARAGGCVPHSVQRWIQTLVAAVPLLALLALWLRLDSAPAPHALLQPALLAPVMLVLTGGLGWVIVRFSRNYMAGDPACARHLQGLLATLTSVSALVISNHAFLFLAAWVAVSLSLHRSLLLYPDRSRAALAAHKKFIAARTAELALLAAFALLWQSTGSVLISDWVTQYRDAPLPVAGQWAMVLVVVAAVIRCAQLPVHGWLMQVVEAPTPVSALLHAGVINLGGFLLLLLAPLLSAAAPARWLLLTVAGASLVLAGLVMTTRISIKVRLAWSTSAQMGMMLVECALGLYDLALLHLVGHSCYKASAFLLSGRAVEQSARQQWQGARPAQPRHWMLALVLTVPVLTLADQLLVPADWPAATRWLVLLVLLPLPAALLAPALASGTRTALRTLLLTVPALLLVYWLQKSVAAVVVDQPPAVAGTAELFWMLGLLGALLAGHLFLIGRESGLRNRVRHLLFAGLYLDEWNTRLTRWLWPRPLPRDLRHKRLLWLMQIEIPTSPRKRSA
ncbi:MAG: NADH-quinone oxidoreductase subunit L [Pseudohongiellaceae bacterium]